MQPEWGLNLIRAGDLCRSNGCRSLLRSGMTTIGPSSLHDDGLKYSSLQKLSQLLVVVCMNRSRRCSLLCMPTSNTFGSTCKRVCPKPQGVLADVLHIQYSCVCFYWQLHQYGERSISKTPEMGYLSGRDQVTLQYIAPAWGRQHSAFGQGVCTASC